MWVKEFKNRSYTVNLLSYGRFVKILGEYSTFSAAKQAILRKWVPEYGDWSIELLGPDGERVKRFWESVGKSYKSYRMRKPRIKILRVGGRGLGPGKGRGPFRGTGLGPGTGQCAKEDIWLSAIDTVSRLAERIGFVFEAKDVYRVMFKSGPSRTFTKIKSAKTFAKRSKEAGQVEQFDKQTRSWRKVG